MFTKKVAERMGSVYKYKMKNTQGKWVDLPEGKDGQVLNMRTMRWEYPQKPLGAEMRIYRVGGSVRDALMGAESKDNDHVVVGGCIAGMEQLGYKKVGAGFPVFLHPETKEEYALARKETKTRRGHKGFECSFGADVTLEEDLQRRDLTINSIAVEVGAGKTIDPHNGIADIRNKLLRATSPKSFVEDPLRVLRVARFMSRFVDFEIEPATFGLM